jgi:hypothetical protein
VRLFFTEKPDALHHGPRRLERDHDGTTLGEPPLVANA